MPEYVEMYQRPDRGVYYKLPDSDVGYGFLAGPGLGAITLLLNQGHVSGYSGLPRNFSQCRLISTWYLDENGEAYELEDV